MAHVMITYTRIINKLLLNQLDTKSVNYNVVFSMLNMICGITARNGCVFSSHLIVRYHILFFCDWRHIFYSWCIFGGCLTFCTPILKRHHNLKPALEDWFKPFKAPRLVDSVFHTNNPQPYNDSRINPLPFLYLLFL